MSTIGHSMRGKNSKPLVYPSMKTSLKPTHFWTLLVVATSFLACQQPTVSPSQTSAAPTLPISVPVALSSPPRSLPQPPTLQDSLPPPNYPWQTVSANQATLQEIPAPTGYNRLVVPPHSFAFWLRHLPLQAAGSPVLLYNGAVKPYQEGAYRVLDIDIGKRDLQQCADAVMRLRAEYLYSQEKYADIHFNYTSGHTIRFSDWSQGKRPKVSGSKVSFTAPTGQQDVSYAQFKRYLTNVFSYAGTASLSKELPTKALATIQAGDVFIQGGFPGHAILVMDVAVHPQTGERLFLLAQSYMPAQSIHILRNLQQSDLSPWYSNRFTGLLETPEWNFEALDLRYFDR